MIDGQNSKFWRRSSFYSFSIFLSWKFKLSFPTPKLSPQTQEAQEIQSLTGVCINVYSNQARINGGGGRNPPWKSMLYLSDWLAELYDSTRVKETCVLKFISFSAHCDGVGLEEWHKERVGHTHNPLITRYPLIMMGGLERIYPPVFNCRVWG